MTKVEHIKNLYGLNMILENNLLCTCWCEWVAAIVWPASLSAWLDSDDEYREMVRGLSLEDVCTFTELVGTPFPP